MKAPTQVPMTVLNAMGFVVLDAATMVGAEDDGSLVEATIVELVIKVGVSKVVGVERPWSYASVDCVMLTLEAVTAELIPEPEGSASGSSLLKGRSTRCIIRGRGGRRWVDGKKSERKLKERKVSLTKAPVRLSGLH